MYQAFRQMLIEDAQYPRWLRVYRMAIRVCAWGCLVWAIVLVSACAKQPGIYSQITVIDLPVGERPGEQRGK